MAANEKPVGGGRRTVYSSEKGRICPVCGWPAGDCHCSSALAPPEEMVPPKVTAKLRVENRGSGKCVTVIDTLPKNAPFLKGLAHELKKTCGTGGRAGDGTIELQGDQRERLRGLLLRKGFAVKG